MGAQGMQAKTGKVRKAMQWWAEGWVMFARSVNPGADRLVGPAPWLHDDGRRSGREADNG